MRLIFREGKCKGIGIVHSVANDVLQTPISPLSMSGGIRNSHNDLGGPRTPNLNPQSGPQSTVTSPRLSTSTPNPTSNPNSAPQSAGPSPRVSVVLTQSTHLEAEKIDELRTAFVSV
jgi:hypothetical protein